MIGENMQSCTRGNFRTVLLISNLHKTIYTVLDLRGHDIEFN